MTKEDIVARVKALKLPAGSYVVFGSGPMAGAGIRETNDIDLYVNSQTLESLARAGWKQVHKGPNDEPYTYEDFEAHAHWDFSPYNPSLEQLLESAEILEGVAFASLEEVRKWKLASGGPKHLADVGLIDAYLAEQKKIGEIAQAWKDYVDTIKDWQVLVSGIAPKASGCGLIYEMPNPIEGRPNEDFCIADMRALKISEPHYHPRNNYEIYFVLQGSGKVITGTKEELVGPGSVVIDPPLTAHYTLPDTELVLAVVSAPPFRLENYIVVTETNLAVGFDKAQFEQMRKGEA